jgi:hypothetical protein
MQEGHPGIRDKLSKLSTVSCKPSARVSDDAILQLSLNLLWIVSCKTITVLGFRVLGLYL